MLSLISLKERWRSPRVIRCSRAPPLLLIDHVPAAPKALSWGPLLIGILTQSYFDTRSDGVNTVLIPKVAVQVMVLMLIDIERWQTD